MTFGELLKTKRLEKGWTQKELADAVYSTVAAISQFEHDKHMPKTDMIYSLAEVLSVPVEILLFQSANVIHEIDVSNSFLSSDDTISVFGCIPDKIAITDIAEHKYRSLKLWNPDYSIEQFMLDVLYPYVKNNPAEINTLLKSYGKAEDTMGQTEQTIAQSITENDLILSKTIRKNIYEDRNNTLIFSNPRAGIHRYMLVPNILNMDTNFVITDINGEMYNWTQKALKAKGYTVKVLNITGQEAPFINEDDLIGYHPMRNCNSVSDVSEFVDSVLTLLHGEEYTAIHIELLRGYLEGCFIMMRDHYTTKEWSIETLLEVIDMSKHRETGYKNMDIVTDEMYMDVMIAVKSLATQTLKQQMEKEFDIDKFMRSEKYAIFVYTNLYRPNANIMNRVFLQQFISKEENLNNIRKTTYIFDELENLPKMPWLTKYMTLSRNKIFLCTSHSIDGFSYRYGKDVASTILSTFDNIVCMGTHDVNTAGFISNISGTNTIKGFKKKLFNGKSEIPVLSTNDVLILRKDDCVVLCRGSKAIVDRVYGIE